MEGREEKKGREEGERKQGKLEHERAKLSL